jgi:hypothetical protein
MEYFETGSYMCALLLGYEEMKLISSACCSGNVALLQLFWKVCTLHGCLVSDLDNYMIEVEMGDTEMV